MTDKMFLESNDLVQRNCEKLYLDSQTADVKFVFQKNTITSTCITAHKILMSAGSPVFHTMFYGSLPEKGDISIVDATPDAFEEFLQFFYLSKVRLTSTNIFQVVNLCKKYEVNDALKLCEVPMKMSLTINNMCSGYAKAKLLEMENVIKYCEQRIKQKASDVLKSTEFMECNHQLLDQILQLVSSECSASDIVDACMAWAKVECERKKVKPTPAKLKLQLKGSFDRIPFAELDSDQFFQHTKAYKRFFVEDELEAIIFKKAKKCEAMLPSRILYCDRRMDKLSCTKMTDMPLEVSFTSNSKLLLKEIYLRRTHRAFDATITLHNSQSKKSVILGTVSHDGVKDVPFVIAFPVFIDRDVKYAIKIESDVKVQLSGLFENTFKDCVMFGGVEIRFDDKSNIIPRIIFQQWGA